MNEPPTNPYEPPQADQPFAAAPPAGAELSNDEKLWAMLSHLAALLVYVSAIGQYVAPLVIYLVYKDKSRFVAFHALQSLLFQLALLVVVFLVTVVGFVTCVGFFLLIPLGIGALIYNIVAAIKAHNGEWFEYWLVGPFARSQVGA
jgi:hypothetical protein